MPTNSAAIITEVRYIVADVDSSIWTDDEIDSAITDGFGVVTYGEKVESGSTTFDKALAKKYASAQLIYSLVRDKAKFTNWVSSAGENVSADQEAERLNELAQSLEESVNEALDRQLDRLKDDVVLNDSPEGAIMDFAPNLTKHRSQNFNTLGRRLNKPKA